MILLETLNNLNCQNSYINILFSYLFENLRCTVFFMFVVLFATGCNLNVIMWGCDNIIIKLNVMCNLAICKIRIIICYSRINLYMYIGFYLHSLWSCLVLILAKNS